MEMNNSCTHTVQQRLTGIDRGFHAAWQAFEHENTFRAVNLSTLVVLQLKNEAVNVRNSYIQYLSMQSCTHYHLYMCIYIYVYIYVYNIHTLIFLICPSNRSDHIMHVMNPTLGAWNLYQVLQSLKAKGLCFYLKWVLEVTYLQGEDKTIYWLMWCNIVSLIEKLRIWN